MKKVIFILIILNLALAANNAGDFLNNNKTARAQGLGNAFSALADDSTAVFYNPAGLAQQNEKEVFFQSTNIIGVDYLMFASNFQWQEEKMGIALLNGNVGGIKEAKLDNSGDPYFTGDTFSWTGRAIYLSWAKDLNAPISQPLSPSAGQEGLVSPGNIVTADLSIEVLKEITKTNLGQIGLNLKIINENLYDAKAYGYGIDLGYLYRYSEQLRVAFVIENMLRPQLTWNTENNTKEFVPLNLKLGSAYKLNEQLTLLTEISKKDDRDAQLQGGAEYWLFKQADFAFGVRGGLEPKAASLGFTMQINNLKVDYAFVNSDYTEDLGQTHKVAVGWKL